MDLTLFFRVVWRYRLLVLAGFTFALLIAFFAAVRITPGGEKLLTLRGEGQYSSATTIFVTQQGFPWGRLPEDDPNGGSQAAEDSGRLAGLATLYAKLVDSDPVTDAAKRQLPATGWVIEAAPVLDGAGLSSPLPLISVIAVANSPELAEKAVGVTTSSLLTYVSDRQNEANIPADERVVLQRIKGPTEPLTVKGRSFTFPIVVFLLFLMLTLAAPFILDNIRRSVSAVRGAAAPPAPPETRRHPVPWAEVMEEDFEFDGEERRRRMVEAAEERRRRIAELKES
jgi:hypothetical protein